MVLTGKRRRGIHKSGQIDAAGIIGAIAKQNHRANGQGSGLIGQLPQALADLSGSLHSPCSCLSAANALTPAPKR